MCVSASTVASTRQYGFLPRARSESLARRTRGGDVRVRKRDAHAAAQSAAARTRRPARPSAARSAVRTKQANAAELRCTGSRVDYPVFKGPATLYVLRMTPDGVACRADELEGPCRGSLREEALPRAQQDRRDDQHDVIREPMFEQRRCQRGAAREDKVRAVLRLDAANALDDVRSNALERAPLQDFPDGGSRHTSLPH